MSSVKTLQTVVLKTFFWQLHTVVSSCNLWSLMISSFLLLWAHSNFSTFFRSGSSLTIMVWIWFFQIGYFCLQETWVCRLLKELIDRLQLQKVAAGSVLTKQIWWWGFECDHFIIYMIIYGHMMFPDLANWYQMHGHFIKDVDEHAIYDDIGQMIRFVL